MNHPFFSQRKEQKEWFQMAAELGNNFEINMTAEKNKDFHNTVTSHVKQLLPSCLEGKCFEKLDSTPIPTQEPVIRIIQLTRRIIFPGYFNQSEISSSNLQYFRLICPS